MTAAQPDRAPSGRLELTWTNKHQRLLAHEDGSYEWTAPSDYRVAEVRLLHNVVTVGEVAADRDRARDNLLIRGDALHALTSLSSIPEFRDEYLGKVKLAYIDPPFNTGQTFEHYDDALEHSVWLTMMRDRLVQIRDLLRPDGTVWLHLDNTEVHRARVVLDEIFGTANFLATVVWQRTSAKSLAKRTMGTMHESILVYAASGAATLKTVYLAQSEAYVAKRYTQQDERGRYDTGDLTASSHRPHLDSGKPWRDFDPSALGRCWAVPRAPLVEAGLDDEHIAGMSMREKLDALDAAGFVHWPASGGFPRLKRYLHNVRGVAVGDLWTDINVINSQASERTVFSTQKPEALLARVLHMASEPGDIVLDCFLGSGTTAAVAHKMSRRWVAVERLQSTVEEVALPRLQSVVQGADNGGVTVDVGWSGGDGFRVLNVAPSMFEVVGGRVMLAEWATGGALAEAVAAQASFAFEDDTPFSGRKGRQRLAVIDGLVNEDVLRLILPWLMEGELLTVYGTAVDPACKAVLSELRRGSSVKRIPQSVLDDYRRGGSRSDGLEWPSVVVQAQPSGGVDSPAEAGAAR